MIRIPPPRKFDFIWFLNIILVIVLIILFIFSNNIDLKREKELSELQIQYLNEEKIKQEKLLDLEKSSSFYQKLINGFDVNILIVGDSIGAGSGASTISTAWSNLLKFYIRERYNVGVNIKNVSMGGNASYAGYVRVMELKDDVDYDLAIICYGQNDSPKDFSLYYESIIRAISSKYKKCSIISILESSQKEYTDKMETIKKIGEYYGIPIADTIAPFLNSTKPLTRDGAHPNDEGQKIYFETVKNVIDQNKGKGFVSYLKTPINQNIYQFDSFRYYSKNDFTREGNTFVLNEIQEIKSIKGVLGIDYSYQSGKNRTEVYVDNYLLIAPEVNFDYDFSQRHILILSKDSTVNNQIKVVFESKEQADGFEGVVFSWE